MRKYCIVILGILIMLLSGCNNRTMDDIIENEQSIVGIVTEVNDKYIQIYIENDGYPSGALCNVSLDVENKEGLYSPIKVGDEVMVYFDGGIAECDPMQINKVYGITLQKPVSREGTYTQITMREAVTMMENETGYIILDVRTAEEFADKHITNAINIPNEVIGTEEITELPDKEQLILVYCRSGNRSKQASEKLAALGYTNIYEFGGINDWTGETVSEK